MLIMMSTILAPHFIIHPILNSCYPYEVSLQIYMFPLLICRCHMSLEAYPSLDL